MELMIAPSILSADFADMATVVENLNTSGADYIHCDVMDGVFVPNLTFGFKMIADIKKRSKLPLDVHLMIVEPSRYVERFIDAGADILSFHVEAEKEIEKTVRVIKDRGCKAFLTISPDTSVDKIKEFIPILDGVLVMSVYPGFAAQKFIPSSLDKVRALSALKSELNSELIIEIDGGINFENVREAAKAGVNTAVAGNAVFSAKDYQAAVTTLKRNAQ